MLLTAQNALVVLTLRIIVITCFIVHTMLLPGKEMFLSLADIRNVIVDESVLLYGSPELSRNNNIRIFQAVQTFIEESNRL